MPNSKNPTDTIFIRAHYYQQFDADHSREVPAESYGGWQCAPIPVSRRHTALVVMHAWDMGTPEQYPGWWRAVEYIPRAQKILKEVFPRLLLAVRAAGLRVFHVAGGGEYGRKYPGYRFVQEVSGEEPPTPGPLSPDPIYEELREFRAKHVFVGPHNEPDVAAGFRNLDFPPEARPVGDEPVAETTHQLVSVCRHFGINHLIYTGFALNWCLLLSPGGMADMSRHGAICSTIREATTAVENKETARQELCKEVALWRVALAFGFVFELEDFLRALSDSSSST